MFVSGMNTCNYSHNNNPTKQKTYTFQTLFIYLCIYTRVNFSRSLKLYISHVNISYIFTFIYMYKHVVKISTKFKELKKSLISRVLRHVDHWSKENKKLWISTAFNKETGDYVRWKQKHVNLHEKKESLMKSQEFEWDCLMGILS